MNLKKLGVLAFILALLGVYYYFFEIKAGREKEEAKENAKKVIVFKSEDVKEFRLKSQNKTVLFSKEKDQWRIKEPLVAKAENESVESALAILRKAEIERTVNENPDNLSEYGLDKPSLEISIKGEVSPPLEKILVGNKNPTDYYVYIKKEKSPHVMLTNSGLKDGLDKELYYYRDKTVLGLKIEDIKRLQIKYQGKEANLELDNKDDWQLTEPIKTKADGGVIRRLLYSLKNSKVKEFVEENPTELKKYGLDSPARMVIFFADKKQPGKSLLIGGRWKKGGVFAKWGDKKDVFMIPDDSVKGYPETEYHLRDKMVLDFKKEEVVKVALRYPDEEIKEIIVTSESENQWKIIKPLEVRADEFEISDLLWALLDMEAEKFVSDGPADLKAYNLNKPIIEVDVWEKGVEVPLTLFISKKTEKTKKLFAKNSVTGTIYQISDDILKDLKKTPFGLRDKTIISFKNEDVKKIRLKYTDKTFMLQLGRRDWKSVVPEKTLLNKAKVISFLWDIKLLKFKEILSEDEKDPLMYGFDKPKAEIVLWSEEEKKIGTVIIGGEVAEKDYLYAKVDSSPTVYGIDPQFLKRLPRSINNLK